MTTDHEPDATIIVTQQNRERQLVIQSLTEGAAQLIGFAPHELIGKPFEFIAGKRVKQAIVENLEFEDDAPDLSDILKRTRDFRLRSPRGEELPFVLNIVRDEPLDRNQWFRLSLRSEQRQKERTVPNLLKEHLEGIQAIDQATGLPNAETAAQYLGIVANYVRTHGLEAVLATIRLDRYEKSVQRYGFDETMKQVKFMGDTCIAKFRNDDAVMLIEPQTLGLFLFDIQPEAARVVLNRLRWAIASQRIDFGGKADFSVSVSVAFRPLNNTLANDDAIERCIAALDAVGAEERNLLLEA